MANAALRRNWLRYSKRVSATRFSLDEVKKAVENASMERSGCRGVMPAPGVTDTHLLVARLIEGV